MKHNPLVVILLASALLSMFLFSTDRELADPHSYNKQSELYYMYRSGLSAVGIAVAESSDAAQSAKSIPGFFKQYLDAHKESDQEFYLEHCNRKIQDQIKNHNQAVLKNRKKS